MERGADARDDILALSVHQIVAVEDILASRRVASESHARAGGLAHVPEHHHLYVDRGAPVVGDLVHVAVGDGAVIVPGREYRAHALKQLVFGLGRKGLANLLLVDRLLHLDDLLQPLGRDVGVILDALLLLDLGQALLEKPAIHVHDDIAEHHDEAAIGIPHESLIAGEPDHRLGNLVVHPQVQHGVHHAGHAVARAGAH